MQAPEPGTIVVWSDIACPWASLAVHRLFTARSRLGLDEDVRFDHRPFPLELINERPTPKKVLDAEICSVGTHEPELGWQLWQRREAEWPGSVLVALEAVQAAKSDAVGGLAASEALDRALRQAFYARSRPIGLLTEVLAIAEGCPEVDTAALDAALAQGTGRAEVVAGWRGFAEAGVQGSPHVFLPDGTDVHNPGITAEWTGDRGRGLPLITADRPEVYDDLLRSALAPAG